MKILSSVSKTAIISLGLTMAACGGGGGSSTPPPGSGSAPPPPPPPSSTEMGSKTEVSDFLAKASFGATAEDHDSLVGSDATAWLTQQFALPATKHLPGLVARDQGGEDLKRRNFTEVVWDGLIGGEDELRQRMVFALSQILVVSDKSINRPLALAYYADILSEHAFGNYRDLLQDVTYSPAMAQYLTYLRNKKGDPRTGRTPDENYARELLQLFTIGLVELNMDGTPKTDANGEPIEIFDNDDIVGLARVFTGLSLKGSAFWNADPDGYYHPLQAFADKHSELEKSFLGTTIAAGTDADASIDAALDHIFDHPNLAPFVSRQLIQRFTASHPSPDYVERVANAFESGSFTAENGARFGTGQRGDLEATLAAILLDRSLYDEIPPGPNDGKIREPVIRLVHWAKAFNVSEIDASNEWLLIDSDDSSRLSQRPFGSPSVFNFYRPGFIAPGTETGNNDLTAPEFQIVHEGATIGYVNYISHFVRNETHERNSEYDTFVPDYSDELALSDKPDDLADHLNELLLAGRMSSTTRDRIISVLNEIPIRDDPEKTDQDKLSRVHAAVTMAVTDPAFTIQL